MSHLPVPNPADFPTHDAFMAAYADYRRQVNAAADADLLAKLAAAGARTADCPCGYSPFDSCPVHD